MSKKLTKFQTSSYNCLRQTNKRIGLVTVACRYLICLGVVTLVGCDGSSGGQAQLNQPAGLELNPPEFLQSRAVVPSNLDARVSALVNGVIYEATNIRFETSWVGEIYVPEGNDATLTIDWIEKNVVDFDLPNDELLLATYSEVIPSMDENQSVEIFTEQYVTESTDINPMPSLDLDSDGVSNLSERQAGSNPNSELDIPAVVTIEYSRVSPNIDGHYDELWNEVNFHKIDTEVEGNGTTVIDHDYKWAGMHDRQFLYLVIIAEEGDQQTPYGDSDDSWNDDTVDIYWDGDNSKLPNYDKVDDFQILIPLLSFNGGANKSTEDDHRLEYGSRSTKLDSSAIEYATCVCVGYEQVYEIKLNLDMAKIPIGSRFGLDIHLNNDVDGGDRDFQWAWYDKFGTDNVWDNPGKMGTAILEQ